MAIIKGVVDKISKRKAGSGYIHAFLVNEEWYRVGFDAPKFKEGYLVKFDDSPINKYGQIDLAGLKFKKGEPKVNTKSPTQAAKGEKKEYKGSKGNSNNSTENWDARAKYWEDKEKRDIVTSEQYNYRSAFHISVELINKGIELDILKVGTAKATGPKKWEAYLTMIDGLAADIHQKFLAAGNVPAVPEKEAEPEEDDDDIPWGDEEEEKEAPKEDSDDDDWDD